EPRYSMFRAKIRGLNYADLTTQRNGDLDCRLQLICGIPFDHIILRGVGDNLQNVKHADRKRGIKKHLAVELRYRVTLEPAIDDLQVFHFYREAQSLLYLAFTRARGPGRHVFEHFEFAG